MPSRLLHVPSDPEQNLQLQDTRYKFGQYAALSYVWGANLNFKTTWTTINSMKDGFDAAKLPKTLRDAVVVTPHLGLEYLWIDALCIIQGDTKDWDEESSKMASVYGNATIAISADLVAHADDGILRRRELLKYSHVFGQHSEFCLQEVDNRNHLNALPKHPLGDRGWTLSERLLSSRILHFLDKQLVWECSTTVYIEETRCQFQRSMYLGNEFSLREFNKHIQTGCGYSEALIPFVQWRGTEIEEHLLRRIEFWNCCLENLTRRKFTFLTDTLPSMSSVATAFELPGLGKYLAGVWEYNPFLSMGWYTKSFSRPTTQVYRAPSWSWAAVDGPIGWVHDIYKIGPRKIDISKMSPWSEQFGPRLLEYDIRPKNADRKGEIMEGSYLIVRGFCRTIYTPKLPHLPRSKGYVSQLKRIHMDGEKPENQSVYSQRSYFGEELKYETLYEERGELPQELDDSTLEAEFRKYTCFQVFHNQPICATYSLILENVNSTTALSDSSEAQPETFKRVGILVLNPPDKILQIVEEQDERIFRDMRERWYEITIKLI